jgi:outer membrane protein assembly factor BamB
VADLNSKQRGSSAGSRWRSWPVTTKAGIWILGGLMLACLPCLLWTLAGYGGVAFSEARAHFLPLGFLLLGLLAVCGVLLWRDKARYPRRVVAGLTIAGVVVASVTGWFMASEFRLRYGPAAVAAFDGVSGKPVWTARLSGTGGVSTPLIGAGVVLVQTGEAYESSAGTLVALDPRDGRRLWHVETEGGNCGGAIAGNDPPVVVDGVAVLPGPDGQVRGVGARDGRERWRAPVAGAPAAAAGGVVLVGGQSTYAGLDAATGVPRWTRTIPDGAFSDWRPAGRALVLGAGSAFVIEVTSDGPFGMAALDAGSGRELWRDTIAWPAWTSKHFVLDGAGTVAAFQGQPETLVRLVGRDLRTGKVLWTTPPLPVNRDGMPQTQIAASPGAVFHASANGQLVALDARTGVQRWTTMFPAETGDFQLAADQNMVIIQQGYRLFGFDPSTGAKRWSARLKSGNEPDNAPAVGDGLVMVPQSTSCILPASGG